MSNVCRPKKRIVLENVRHVLYCLIKKRCIELSVCLDLLSENTGSELCFQFRAVFQAEPAAKVKPERNTVLQLTGWSHRWYIARHFQFEEDWGEMMLSELGQSS